MGVERASSGASVSPYACGAYIVSLRNLSQILDEVQKSKESEKELATHGNVATIRHGPNKRQ